MLLRAALVNVSLPLEKIGVKRMRSFFSVGGIVTTGLLLFAGVDGQDARFGNDPDFESAKIVSTPRLTVPQDAIESGLGGTVRVLVAVDDAGNVTSADDVTGPGPVCKSVTRRDVVAMRGAAKEASMLAKFMPATNKGEPVASSLWLNFDFPTREKKEAESTAYAASNTLPRYTVKGDINFNAANAPPPDYKGPVNTGRSGETLPAPDVSNIPKQISGGVLNGKATSLPKPPYPPAARAVRASGAVSIQVLIDENGEAFTAQAVSGHPLLRAASTTAACGARFSPTTLEGNPVKVSGIITYNFVP